MAYLLGIFIMSLIVVTSADPNKVSDHVYPSERERYSHSVIQHELESALKGDDIQ